MRERELPDKISLDARRRTYPELGEKVGRNEKVVRDYLSGMKVKEIANEYGMTITRVYAILNMYRIDD